MNKFLYVLMRLLGDFQGKMTTHNKYNVFLKILKYNIIY
jgi:hypothetical protein